MVSFLVYVEERAGQSELQLRGAFWIRDNAGGPCQRQSSGLLID